MDIHCLLCHPQNNADHSILFEAVNLIISQGSDSDSKLRNHAIVLLGKYLTVLEPNIRLGESCRQLGWREA